MNTLSFKGVKSWLMQEDAIALWQKGKDEWNEWVGGHLDWAVCFAQVDFANLVPKEQKTNFAGYRFPNGGVQFCLAHFRHGDVTFRDADFGEGHVDFSHVDFGELDQKDNGFTDFEHAKFGKGTVSFEGAKFGRCAVSFHGAHWVGRCVFTPWKAEDCTEIDFSSITVDGELEFGKLKTSCVIDLRHSKLNRPLDLDRVDINYQTENGERSRWPLYYRKAINEEASTCFRRLKKLAKEADDHDRALEFFAKEIRTSYDRELTGYRLKLYLVYDKLSDFGRSLTTPAKWLGIMILLFGLAYFNLSIWPNQNSLESFSQIVERFGVALTFSLAHALPFYFGSRTANSDTLKALFPCEIPDYLHWLTIGQGVICGVLLFLIALALRNHFRS